MAHPWYHSLSHAKRFGGVAEDYTPLNTWLDQTKAFTADCRHRLVLHNAWGIFLAERHFGLLYTRASDGAKLPTRPLAERHVFEDLGSIPGVAQCLAQLPPEPPDTEDVGALVAHYAGTLLVDVPTVEATLSLLYSTRAHLADRRHRRLLFNSWGIDLVSSLLGPLDAPGNGAAYRVASQVVLDRYDGRIPTIDESLDGIAFQPWMCRAAQRLSQSLGTSVATGRPTFVTNAR